MSNHISDELPRLLTGDASRDVVLTAATHLRTCPDCQQELVSAVVAHASLTSAHRFAPEIMASVSPTQDDVTGETPGASLPDLSSVFAQAENEASSAAARPRGPAVRRRLLAVAAAVVVLGGGGAAITTITGSDRPSVRTVGLEAYGIGTHPAKVTIVGNTTLTIDATALPKLSGQKFYELWLTGGPRPAPQAVGTIDNNDRSQFSVSPKVMSEYTWFQVSVQHVGQTEFSGVSVLRGDYS